MAELVSKTYALSLFEAGLELEKIDEIKENIDFTEDVFKEDAKLLTLLKHPRIKKSEKKDILDQIFKERVEKEYLNFLYILIDKRRESEILNIVEQFDELYNQHKNIVKVIAITAVPMDEKAKEKLSQNLGSKLNRTILLENKVDKSIVGGVVLKLDNQIVDGSIKGKLEEIGRIVTKAN